MDAEKKVALITGSNSGLGAVTAVEFAKTGMRVTLTDRRVDRINDVSRRCQAAGLSTDDVLVMQGDVTDDSVIKSIVKATINKFGRLDIMVNNAAMAPLGNGVMDSTMETYDMVMRTNLRAPIIFTKEVVPHLEITKGCIINVSSLASKVPTNEHVFYTISKTVLDQLTRCSSTELAANGIRVNSVNPGYIDSTMHEQLGIDRSSHEKFMKSILDIQPLQHIIRCEDVAKAIIFLTSEEARLITGINLVVDGGYGNVVPFLNST